MKRFAIVGIVVLLIAILAALVFVGWNVYSLRQTQTGLVPNEAFGRGMMRGSIDQTAPNARGGMMGRGMMGGNNNPGMMEHCPCASGDNSSAPSTNPVPTVAPNTGASSSAASSSASSVTPGVLSKSGNGYAGKAGNLNVAVTMNPTPAAFSTTTFDLTLTDEKGAAVSDAKVSLDLTMPSMWMPSNKPQAQSLGDGKYQAAGRFTMRGGWRINVIIERGGQKQTAYFDIGL
jgi:hypothetical protein